MISFLKKEEEKRCDHCSQVDYQNAKLTSLLGWLCNRLQYPTYIRENCELQSWWNNHQRAYRAELQRQKDERELNEATQKALLKLNPKEQELVQNHFIKAKAR